MTLNEYINQVKPQSGLKVVLNEDEFEVRGSIKINPTTYHTLIHIPIIAEKYKISGDYIQINTGLQLYALHPIGDINKKGSVFYLPEKYAEYFKIEMYREFLVVNASFLAQWIEVNPNPTDMEEHNKRFFESYSKFLNSIKDKYWLSEEEIRWRLRGM